MRHVTDGELHAYLDGALDLLPGGRGEEVREHLTECPACRERLQDEEAVRDRAGDILAGSHIGEVDLPPFEELRERATAPEPGAVPMEPDSREEGRTRYQGPLKGVPLAWAATIVLALGVGWMGGEVWRTLPREGRPGPVGGGAGARGAAGPREAADTVGGVDIGEFVGTGRAAPGERVPPETAEERSQQVFTEPRSADVRSADTVVAEPRSDVLPPADARPGVLPPIDSRGVDARSGAPPSAGVRSDALTSGALRAPGEDVLFDALVRGRPAAPSLAPQQLQVTGGAPTPEEAARQLPGQREEEQFPGSSLAVPGLRVLSVEWEEWLPGERALHIRQLLSVGDTLELRYLGMLMGMEPDEEARAARKVEARDAGVDRPLSPAVLEASLPPGWNQVEMRWGRGWLVARAPLPEAYIKALLRSLR